MTYQRARRSRWALGAGTALATMLAIGAGSLAPAISPAPAGAATTTSTTTPTTTTRPTTTTSTTTTTAPTTTTTTTVPGSNCSASVSGAPLDRSGWVASSNAPSGSADAPAHALDGNLATRFSSGKDQAPGLYFEVDLASTPTLYGLQMNVPNSPTDYAWGYDVEVSVDGSTWATVAACTGSGTSETVTFAAHKARYAKVVLTAAAPKWWSIDELNLYGHPATTATTTSLSSSANPATTGQPVTYTALVSPVPNGGTVGFFGDGSPLAGCGQVAVSTSAGTATCTTSYVPTGHYGVQAFYSGAATFGPSTSDALTEAIDLPAPGYWVVTANGQVFGSGAAPALGNATTSATTGPVVGIAADAHGQGLLGGHGQRQR